MKKILPLVCIALAACSSHSVKVLEAPWVSMKHSGPPADANKLKYQGTISEKYCQKNWTGSYGLMDEVVKQAEEAGKIDYVRNAAFYQDSQQPCITLSGDAYKAIN